MINIKLLCLILDEGFHKKANNVLNRLGIKFKTVSTASGTASPSILDYFGLAESRKELFLAIIPENLKYKVLEKVNNAIHLDKEGTGIGFVLPISSSNKFLSESFNKIDMVGDDDNMAKVKKYHLIITIVYEGYLEKVMTAAKRAGCNGGTVMKGRSLSDVIPTKILGFNIEQERDVVLNIVEDKDKTKVMEEISKDCGIKTTGKGICFSIPIEATMGLDGR